VLGYDPHLLPIVREAFGHFPWPIAASQPDETTIKGDWGIGTVNQIINEMPPVIHPFGWRDAVPQTVNDRHVS
jgi:hypothetical protein